LVIGRFRPFAKGGFVGKPHQHDLFAVDDAVLKTSARSTSTQGFIAKNASVTYSISPDELRVTVGGAVIKQEPMIDYRGSAL
jgi:hypothetical protein